MEKKLSRAKPPPRGSGARTHGTHHADAPSPPALANHASHENTNSANTRQPHTHAPERRHARAHAAEAAAMPPRGPKFVRQKEKVLQYEYCMSSYSDTLPCGYCYC